MQYAWSGLLQKEKKSGVFALIRLNMSSEFRHLASLANNLHIRPLAVTTVRFFLIR